MASDSGVEIIGIFLILFIIYFVTTDNKNYTSDPYDFAMHHRNFLASISYCFGSSRPSHLNGCRILLPSISISFTISTHGSNKSPILITVVRALKFKVILL